MPTLPFYKMHGLGNDFVLMEGPALPSGTDLNRLARHVCARHFGIGADGLILHWPAEKAHARMQILNSDGSESEMCGNGLRCFAAYLQTQGQMQNPLQIQTGAGLLSVEQDSQSGLQRVNMGPPRLRPEEIPVTGFTSDAVVEDFLHVGEQSFVVTLVSMGNPHCVIRVPSLEQVDFPFWGPRLESHLAFPARANIEFVEMLSPQLAQVKVWERGVGSTLACGTGACAVLVAGVLGKWLENRAEIRLPGGSLWIEWRGKHEPVWMEGPATTVFRGEIDVEITES